MLKKLPIKKLVKNSIMSFFYYHFKVKKNIIMICPAGKAPYSKNMQAVLAAVPADRSLCILTAEKKGTIRYFQKLARAKHIISEIPLVEGWCKKADQQYIKLITSENVENYRKELLKTSENRQAQIEAFQVDYFICENETVVQSLKRAECLCNFSKAKIVGLKNGQIETENIYTFDYNNKENVLLYSSALEQNGLTSSLLNMFGRIDLEERNYWVCSKFPEEANVGDQMARLPVEVGVKAMSIAFTLGEFVAKICYHKLNLSWSVFVRQLERLYEREYRRNFSNMRIDIMVQFTGYEAEIIHLFAMGEARHIIYVHSDMEQEIQLRKVQHKVTLQEMYEKYDVVAIVNENLLEPTKRIGGSRAKYIVVNNFFDYEKIRKNGEKKLEFDESTQCNYSLQKVEQILEGSGEKFITIGRFSKEKGHFMLLEAFKEYCSEHEKSHLFIIGGRGQLYEATQAYAESLGIAQNVILIREMKNPMPILKRCDLFILPSLYEGFGLVVLEAAALGIPVITTDTVGSAEFVRKYGGETVDCSVEGILSGMMMYAEKKLMPMQIDFEGYNRCCMEQLNTIL